MVKPKTPIVFGVGVVIVAMVTTFFCGYILEPVTSGTQDQYNMALGKIEFSELLRQALPWQPHISGKIISFSFSFCSFYPIGIQFGTQDRYNMTLSKIEFSELLRQALPWQPHISGKNNFIFFSFCSFYPIGMKFGTQDRYNMAL